jgi:hypothetical protein
MDFKKNAGSDGDSKQGAAGEKGKQNGLLVLLLILVAGLGYVYFFTDLIKPGQEQKVAEMPAAPQVVKKPLPSPDGKPAKADPVDGEGAAKKDVPPAKPEPAKVAAAPVAAPVAPAKPAEQAPAKPKEPEKKADALQPAVKKPLPVAGSKPADVKKATADKKQPEAVERKAALPKETDKKSAGDVKKPAEKSAVAAAKPKADIKKPAKSEPAVAGDVTAKGGYTVLVGNYVLEETMATDLARVRNAGLEVFIVPGTPKKTHMNRLLLAEFTDRASAQAELDKLKRHTSDAFILDSAGMHVVYAGSYLLDARATSEKERLASAGFGLTLKRADVSIPSKNLTAGTFTDKNVADSTIKKLRAAGIKATLTR